MAHPLHQDPEPSEAKRRRKGLAQQAVQGKCLIHFHFIEADQVTLITFGSLFATFGKVFVYENLV